MPIPAVAEVAARTAIAGNPSDGYGGAVVAVPVPGLAARATAIDGPGDRSALVLAARRRFDDDVASVADVGVEIETTIPRSVGLAGSSAIVIAVIRVLEQVAGVRLDPDAVAELAHRVERVDLGIAGGWQDQIVQSRGRPLLMEFGGGRRSVRVLTPPALGLFVAWRPSAAESSGIVHADLRARAAQLDEAMGELAAAARTAALALEAGDVESLAGAMERTLELRASIVTLDPRHLASVEIARRHGVAANYAGSGGAVVGILPDDPEPLVAHLTSAGHEIHAWELT